MSTTVHREASSPNNNSSSTIVPPSTATSAVSSPQPITVNDLTTSQRILSASAGSLLTSLSVTPFDVIKVRLQAQRPAPLASSSLPNTSVTTNGSGQTGIIGALRKNGVPRAPLVECTHYHLHTGLTDVWCRKCDMTPPVKPRSAALPPLRFTGSVDAAVKLIQYEGVSSLWRGLAPTLVLSIPSTVVYFNLYDQFKTECERRNVPYPPLVAGTTARALTTTFVSPIELIRTKVQALPENVRMMAMVQSEIRTGGIGSLWRGVSPTLWRDVPFSAVYWSAYEYSKKQLTPWANGENGSPILASFISGASSGTLAALLTHPFDLVKTRRQIKMYEIPVAEPPPVETVRAVRAEPVPSSVHYDHAHAQSHAHAHAMATQQQKTVAATSSTHSNTSTSAAASSASSSRRPLPTAGGGNTATATYGVMKTIVAEEGWIGLTNGLGARIGKIAPACAIMITTFETTKRYFLQSNNDTTSAAATTVVVSKAPRQTIVAASSAATATGAVVASSESVSS